MTSRLAALALMVRRRIIHGKSPEILTILLSYYGYRIIWRQSTKFDNYTAEQFGLKIQDKDMHYLQFLFLCVPLYLFL